MRRQLRVYLLVLGFVVLAVSARRSSSHVKADDDEHEGIVGTWIITAALPGNPPLVWPELFVINPGGTTTSTSSHLSAHFSGNPFSPPRLALDFSDRYGAWKQLGDTNQFAFTYKQFIFAGANTSKELYGPFFVGQRVGTATMQMVATLQHDDDGDTLAGTVTKQDRNLRGEVVSRGSGTFSGKRLEIEPLATP